MANRPQCGIDAARTGNIMNKYLKKLMKKANPVAQLLMNPTFRQQTVMSKKEYNRKKIRGKDTRNEKTNV